jgi:MFS superfamily sulfate permease-like transporter
MPGRGGLYKLHREPSAEPIPGLAIYLVLGDLVFFNVDYVRNRIRWIVHHLPASTHWFIIDAQSIAVVDVTAAAALDQVREELHQRRIQLGFANLHSQPRTSARKTGLLAKVGPKCRSIVRRMPFWLSRAGQPDRSFQLRTASKIDRGAHSNSST